MSRFPLRPALVVSSALAVWCAQSCLAPGSLRDEQLFRVRTDASAVEGGGSDVGCAAACTTFRTTCSTTGCHSSDSRTANLDLESPGIVARLSGQPAMTVACFDETLLVPGDPAKSLVYRKLTDPPSCGQRMPLTGSLSAAEIDCVRRWVLAPSCDERRDGGTVDAAAGAAGAGTGGTSSGGMPASGGAAGMMAAGGRRGSGGSNGGAGMSGSAGMSGRAGMSGAGGSNGGAGMSGAGGNPAVGSVIYIEAESGTLTDPMATSMDANASGGMFISAPASATKNDDPTMSTMGIATYSFDVKTAGDYIGFGRELSAATSADSFWIKMDDGAWIQWNNLTNGTAWVWDDFHDSAQTDAVVHYTLKTGTHQFSVAYREAGAELDKLVFAGDPAFMPMGLGQ